MRERERDPLLRVSSKSVSSNAKSILLSLEHNLPCFLLFRDMQNHVNFSQKRPYSVLSRMSYKWILVMLTDLKPTLNEKGPSEICQNVLAWRRRTVRWIVRAIRLSQKKKLDGGFNFTDLLGVDQTKGVYTVLSFIWPKRTICLKFAHTTWAFLRLNNPKQ